jgi:hypothetical protein
LMSPVATIPPRPSSKPRAAAPTTAIRLFVMPS